MVVELIVTCGVASLAAAVMFNMRVQSVSVEKGAASPEEFERLTTITKAIRDGAMAFLFREYRTLAVFITLFALVIAILIDDPHTLNVNEGRYSAVAFVVGAITSILAGFIGMRTATAGNVRTAVSARESLEKGFLTAINAGAVMGFGLSGLAVLGMLGCYLALRYGLAAEAPHTIMEILSGFGLGGSSVALFARVGGGIYTKAADVGADLVGKVEAGIPEDDPRNPAVIADNVGDNVGDVAGMGADLFGSVAESTCAAMVIGALTFADNPPALLYPLAISCLGIPSSFLGIVLFKARSEQEVQGTLKKMLMLATILMAIAGYPLTKYLLPAEPFDLGGKVGVTATGVYLSFLSGLISGYLIGWLTEYYTSHTYGPTQEVAKASTTGTATNIIYGLALGYNSAVVPSLLIAATVIIAVSQAGVYGIALSAIGMLGTISVALTIDAYGPVADNAGGLAEMAHMGADIRKRTDVLDAAGNTTAAMGKGFAIGSAALTALALFSAYVTQCNLKEINLLDPWVMAGLLVGGALTCAFSAMTMRSVGLAALDMIEEVRRQFRTIPGLMEGTATAEYAKCVDIATQASLREMLRPGLMVVFTPIIVGWLFGPTMLAGVLIGALITAVIFAISMANSGGSWDNAKKYIESGALGGRGTEAHKAAVVGDTVGDPFKDTSGPALNILIKLMAIISLVFAPFVVNHGGLIRNMLP
ncbi:V-type H(+)-translocating pyrophosphatase [bacterium]|nr:V-type H(+)-translocating pyrophosphatase [bacterium]